jgi:hypothetical protein
LAFFLLPLVDESRPTDEPVGRRMRFWRRTVL